MAVSRHVARAVALAMLLSFDIWKVRTLEGAQRNA